MPMMMAYAGVAKAMRIADETVRRVVWEMKISGV